MKKLSDAFKSVDSPAGRRRVKRYLKTLPFPHYEAHPTKKDWFVRIEANGTRTAGMFVLGVWNVMERL